MDPLFASAGIGALSSLIGGVIGGGTAASVNRNQEAQADANRTMQMAFATRGLTWRGEDAMEGYKRTGIHPLALLGTQGPSYTPTTFMPAENPIGRSIDSAGQNVSRAIMAGADRDIRSRALDLQTTVVENSAKRGSLENELLELNIAAAKARLMQGQGPPMPNVNGTINHPGVEPKIFPDVSVSRTPRGGYVVLPGKEAQERMEEIFGLGPEWFMRNRAWLVTPEARQWVKRFLPSPGEYKEWQYNPPTGEWLPSYKDYGDRHFTNPDVARGADRWRRIYEGGMQ